MDVVAASTYAHRRYYRHTWLSLKFQSNSVLISAVYIHASIFELQPTQYSKRYIPRPFCWSFFRIVAFDDHFIVVCVTMASPDLR